MAKYTITTPSSILMGLIMSDLTLKQPDKTLINKKPLMATIATG